ncbi:acidic endochitinase-like [Oryza brachyantha]|uniref:chitinase n=1 Tax=Oryza brachyantha TaxID=4533 RepID=J3L306_ORYBR|nr:acidic endochitinase-like [Oryza brachyantha]
MAPRLCSTSPFLFAVLHLAAFAAVSNAGQVAVYWGQNNGDGTLTETCASGWYGFVNIAFLNVFGENRAPGLNLAGHCEQATGTCTSLSSEISSCQQSGVKVLLSLGGAAGQYSLSSADDARGVAGYLWDNFLGGSSTSRPFGDALLDGIDFDIETGGGDHYDELAMALASRCNGACLLTAAPQCPYPDARLGAAIRTGVFNHVWVQFYNNKEAQCQYVDGDTSKLLDAWARWTSAVPAPADVFMGLPAERTAATNGGYIDADTLLSQVLPTVKGAANYGGVMLWDRWRDTTARYGEKLQGNV